MCSSHLFCQRTASKIFLTVAVPTANFQGQGNYVTVKLMLWWTVIN